MGSGRLLWAALFLTACSHATRPGTATPSGQAPEALPPARAYDAIAFASQQVGKRYCWGGIGPACFDCSGLVAQAWGVAGVRLPHSSEGIASALREVPTDEVRPGDILWWPGHVALYAGGGWTIEALDMRDGVVRRPSRSPRRVFRPDPLAIR